MSRRRTPGGRRDVVQRLQDRVAEGDYYEALQLYKTSYSRFKAQGRLDDAEELLVTGAIAMAKENELNAATELGLLIATSFEENERAIDSVRLNQLRRVADAMTPGIEMSEYLKRAIRWAGGGDDEDAANELSLIMARSLVSRNKLGDAARYYALSGSPDEHAAMIKRWSKLGYDGERDLFLCRAVLYTLSVGRTEDAATLLAAGRVEARDDGADQGVDTPLINMTSLLVELCQARSEAAGPTREMIETFRELQTTYKISLQRDAYFEDMMSRVGDVHFDLKPPQAGGLMGMLGQLIGGM